MKAADRQAALRREWMVLKDGCLSTWRLGLLFTGFIAACGSSHSERFSLEASADLHFFELLRDQIHLSFSHVATPVEMAGYADVVVVGEIESLEQGGIVSSARSSVARTRVLRSIKGGTIVGAKVFIELLHGQRVSASDLNGALPVPAGLWFLQRAESVLGANPDDEGRGELGVPAGEVLLGPASNQGLVIEGSKELLQPLEPDVDNWFDGMDRYRFLDEMVAEVEASL